MKNVRSKFFVDRKVQGTLARRIILHWIIFFALSLVCIFALEYFLGDPSLSIRGHLAVIWHKYAFFLLLMMTIVPSFVYDSVKLSNRFAGPMVRLRNSITQLADGKSLRKISFRKGDFWGDVSDEFNRLIDRVQRTEAELDALKAENSNSNSRAEESEFQSTPVA